MQAAADMSSFAEIMHSIPWYGWIAILGIICGTFSTLVKSSHRHQERMAKIKHGIDPDQKTTPP